MPDSPGRPRPDEYADFYGRYIAAVGEPLLMVAAMVSLFALGRPVLAQGVGDLVRVTTPRETVVGAISEMDGSGFKLLLPEGWHWEVARNEVEQLEVSTGTKRSTWRGLGFGVGAGLVVSLARMVGAPKRTYCGNQPSIGAAIMCNLARARHPAPLSDSEILTGTTISRYSLAS